MSTAPAGWYPNGSEWESYWDGTAWTDRHRPVSETSRLLPAEPIESVEVAEVTEEIEPDVDSAGPRQKLTWVQRQTEKSERIIERNLLKRNPHPIITTTIYEQSLSRYLSRGWEVVEAVANLGGVTRIMLRIDREKLSDLLQNDTKL